MLLVRGVFVSVRNALFLDLLLLDVRLNIIFLSLETVVDVFLLFFVPKKIIFLN